MLLELGQASWDGRLLAEANRLPPFTAEQLGLMRAGGADTAGAVADYGQQQQQQGPMGGEAAGSAGEGQQQQGQLQQGGADGSDGLWAPTRLTDVK